MVGLLCFEYAALIKFKSTDDEPMKMMNEICSNES